MHVVIFKLSKDIIKIPPSGLMSRTELVVKFYFDAFEIFQNNYQQLENIIILQAGCSWDFVPSGPSPFLH